MLAGLAERKERPKVTDDIGVQDTKQKKHAESSTGSYGLLGPPSKSSQLCCHPGCGKRRFRYGKCLEHGETCAEEGCGNKAISGGKCRRHAGTVKRCSVEGCNKHIVQNGMCTFHGGHIECRHEGCTASRESYGLCMTHAGLMKCTERGCSKRVPVEVRRCAAHAEPEKDGCKQKSKYTSLFCVRCWKRTALEHPDLRDMYPALSCIITSSGRVFQNGHKRGEGSKPWCPHESMLQNIGHGVTQEDEKLFNKLSRRKAGKEQRKRAEEEARANLARSQVSDVTLQPSSTCDGAEQSTARIIAASAVPWRHRRPIVGGRPSSFKMTDGFTSSSHVVTQSHMHWTAGRGS